MTVTINGDSLFLVMANIVQEDNHVIVDKVTRIVWAYDYHCARDKMKSEFSHLKFRDAPQYIDITLCEEAL